MAQASGGTGEYELGWPVRGELLAYRSSGCADDCWVAEVRSKRGRQVRARLRCDDGKLYFSHPAKSREQQLPEDCNSINTSNDKPASISNKLTQLLQSRKGKN